MCLCGAGDGCRDNEGSFPIRISGFNVAGSGGLGVMSGKPENWENAGNAGKIIKISICILIFME